MYSKFNLKTIVCVLFAAVTLLVSTMSTASSQEIFGGRGLAGVGGSGSSFSNPLAPQFDQAVNNPLAGIFKKPAFLENLKMPKLEFPKPNIELPKLGNLIPQRAPGEQSLLTKMKTKTDAFFSKALAFEKIIPGKQDSADDTADWESVRKSMEAILARRGEENPIRSAGATGSTIQR